MTSIPQSSTADRRVVEPGTAAAPVVAICDALPHLVPVFDALAAALDARGLAWRRYPSARDLFAEPARLQDVAVLAGWGSMPVDDDVLAAAPVLRGVVSCFSGTDGFDVEAATARGVIVAHAPTAENSRSVAEAAMLLLLHLFYDLDGTRENLRQGRGKSHPVNARMLHGKTIGLVGWGRIARTLAALLAPWGVRLLVHSRRGTPDDLAAHATAVPLDVLLRESDAVCVLAGAEPGAPPVIDRAGIASMRPTAYLVNLARGALVDEPALVEALQARRIAGAALDVFAVEPLAMDSPLRACPNVILTPHHVGHTREGDDSLLPAIVDNVVALLEGRVPPMVRNPAVLDAWRARFGGHVVPPSAPRRSNRSPAP
jgi:D-3-phosphoglycerate dehydrogenase